MKYSNYKDIYKHNINIYKITKNNQNLNLIEGGMLRGALRRMIRQQKKDDIGDQGEIEKKKLKTDEEPSSEEVPPLEDEKLQLAKTFYKSVLDYLRDFDYSIVDVNSREITTDVVEAEIKKITREYKDNIDSYPYNSNINLLDLILGRVEYSTSCLDELGVRNDGNRDMVFKINHDDPSVSLINRKFIKRVLYLQIHLYILIQIKAFVLTCIKFLDDLYISASQIQTEEGYAKVLSMINFFTTPINSEDIIDDEGLLYRIKLQGLLGTTIDILYRLLGLLESVGFTDDIIMGSEITSMSLEEILDHILRIINTYLNQPGNKVSFDSFESEDLSILESFNFLKNNQFKKQGPKTSQVVKNEFIKDRSEELYKKALHDLIPLKVSESERLNLVFGRHSLDDDDDFVLPSKIKDLEKMLNNPRDLEDIIKKCKEIFKELKKKTLKALPNVNSYQPYDDRNSINLDPECVKILVYLESTFFREIETLKDLLEYQFKQQIYLFYPSIFTIIPSHIRLRSRIDKLNSSITQTASRILSLQQRLPQFYEDKSTKQKLKGYTLDSFSLQITEELTDTYFTDLKRDMDDLAGRLAQMMEKVSQLDIKTRETTTKIEALNELKRIFDDKKDLYLVSAESYILNLKQHIEELATPTEPEPELVLEHDVTLKDLRPLNPLTLASLPAVIAVIAEAA